MAKTDTREQQGRIRETIEHARDRASDAVHGLEANPLGIVVGGLALGAVVGALLPRSERERELLAPLGQRLSNSARAATRAARETGKAEFADLGLTRDAAQDQVRSLLGNVVQAISTTGAAAVTAAREQHSG